MNKKVLFPISVLAIIVLTALISIMISTGGGEVKYNNDKSITSLITKKYSNFDIEKMREDMEHDNLDYSRLKSNYNIQCLRKTYQGYYAVFLQNDGKRVFVFMDEKMRLYDIFVIENIKEKEEYDFIESGKTTESEMLNFDENTVLLPISSIASTAHIVQEGLLVITYDRFDTKTETLLDDPIVKSMVFFNNNDLPLKDDAMINLNVPYILEIDKNHSIAETSARICSEKAFTRYSSEAAARR